jgi:hypothetical protein
MVCIFDDYQTTDRRHLPARQYLFGLGSGRSLVTSGAEKHTPVEGFQTGPARQGISAVASSRAQKILKLTHRPTGASQIARL